MVTLTKFSPSDAPAGRHGLGAGLALVVKPSGSRSWVGTVRVGGKVRSFGLGAFPATDEAGARAALAAKLPAPVSMPAPVVKLSSSLDSPRFGTLADEAAHYRVERGMASANQLSTSVELSCPHWWSRSPSTITRADIIEVLVTAHKERGATVVDKLLTGIREVLDLAVDTGHIEVNPAESRRLLRAVHRRTAPHTATHRKALSSEDARAVAATLQATRGPGAAACLLLMLCANRRDEARECDWTELHRDVWEIPAGRMKSRRTHRIPLSVQARAAIESQRFRSKAFSSPFVFVSGRQPGRAEPVSGAWLRIVWREALGESLGDEDSAHLTGSRSTFRDWCATSGVSRDLAEMCLAHTVAGAVERSYWRSDMLEQRRDVMQSWADFLLPQT